MMTGLNFVLYAFVPNVCLASVGSKLRADIKRMQIANRAALDKDFSFIIATFAFPFYTHRI